MKLYIMSCGAAYKNFQRGRDLHIKQHRKRVSALLLALCMVLSLVMPVSALDGQVQAERREGDDVATTHYTDGEGNERAIPFTETASGYADTLPEGVAEEQVMVEYFSATRWDGAVDLSWYDGTDTEFTLTTPAQLAGVAELVNSNTTDFAGKTIRLGADISLLRYEEPGKPGEPFQPTQPEKPTTPDPPATGDSSNVTALWVVLAVAGVGIIVLVVLLVTKRKNKKD